MLFNSLHFIYFFAVITTLYFAVAHKYRWQLLLAASCYFYMVFLPIYILILGFTILIDYVAGIYIEKSAGKKRKFFLVLSLVANIGVLAIFKYYNFLNSNLSFFLHNLGYHHSLPNLSILLPVGLSFHTFQAMSYTIEVYRAKQKAEKHLGMYALYVMFYPQLVAGPIERPQNMLPQFYKKHTFDYSQVTNGLKLMAWGFFKKVVIADRLAPAVNNVYNDPANFQGFPLLMATFFFALQIYCDFSGYSDIAIGAGEVMGFKLTKNFNRPYFSKSISAFWRRWHISLSTWFRDYVYFSLGGNRVKKSRLYFNLIITFLLSGLWHGANWTYVVWGGLNGLLLIAEIMLTKAIPKNIKEIKPGRLNFFVNLCKWLVTFNLICITWIFFRARNIHEALYIIRNMFVNFKTGISPAIFSEELISRYDLFVLLLSLAVLVWVEWKQRTISIRPWLAQKPALFRWSLYLGLMVSIILFGMYDQIQQFIYFQF